MTQPIPLEIPLLLDLTQTKKATINILTTQHKFSPNANYSGLNTEYPNTPNPAPIFGSSFNLKNKNPADVVTKMMPIGLPTIKMKKGNKYNLTVNNYTGYSFNIHWHGLNTTGDVDGASCLNEFGINTKIGPTINIDFPTIHNNSGILWGHAHPMFSSSAYVQGGIKGLLQITDDISSNIDKLFDYGNNEIPLIYRCVDYYKDGTLNVDNLYTDAWRGTFGTINSQSCVNWATDDSPYVNMLYHNTTKNIAKIILLNATASFRALYIGVCDKNNVVKDFWYVLSDDGYRNPMKTSILNIAPSNRIAILIDLNDFLGGEAYVFFYNFDLTQVLNMTVDNNNNLIADIPDSTYSNPTPAPTPIPGTETEIDYPNVSAVPYYQSLVTGGEQPLPSNYSIKKYLMIKYTGTCGSSITLPTIIEKIRKIVFGSNYDDPFVKKLVKTPNFEYIYANKYNSNYISLLNPLYYYNLPLIKNVPNRSFALFPESSFNYIGPNKNVVPYFNSLTDNNLFYQSFSDASSYSFNYVAQGSTDVNMGASRALVDMWNSLEINQQQAINKYFANYKEKKFFSYKPKVLPTPLFQIFPTGYDSAHFVNYNMISNDTLVIDVFAPSVNITGIDSSSECPINSVTIKFNEVSLLNIEKWTKMVNNTFKNTFISLGCNCGPICGCGQGAKCDCVKIKLSDIIEYDWTYYPYALAGYNLITNPPPPQQYLNSVMIRIVNKSKYKLRLTGKWELLNYFGVPFTAMSGMSGMTMPNPPLNPNQLPTSTTLNSQMTKSTNTDMSNMPYNFDVYVRDIGVNYPDPTNPYDVNNPDSGTTLTATDEVCYFVVQPLDLTNDDRENNGVYKGFFDGFMNDGLQNFSVKLDSTERWNYYNWDAQDTHPFHFHLTSGFVDYTNSSNSPTLNPSMYYNQYPYSNDVYAVASQQNLSFFLKFSNYSSEQGSMYNGKLVNLGYMYHCHYMAHHDMNMMGQYYVYKNNFLDI